MRWLVVLLLLAGCSTPEIQGTVVCVGGSLTAGLGGDVEESYPKQIESELAKRDLHYRVINSGVSGETSAGLLSRVDWLTSLNPELVVVETGSSDFERGIYLENTRRNVKEIISFLQAEEVPVLLLKNTPINAPEDYQQEYAAMLVEISETQDIELIDTGVETYKPSTKESEIIGKELLTSIFRLL